MTVLILSDTHGSRERLKRVLSLHRNSDAIIHLGDECKDLDGLDLGGLPLYCVRGNWDEGNVGFGVLADEELIELDGVRILVTHGHRLGVKAGLVKAASYAVSKAADVLLYGHTHKPDIIHLSAGDRVGVKQLDKPLWLFNPGSLGRPGGGKDPSFGVLTIRNGQVLFSHGRVDR